MAGAGVSILGLGGCNITQFLQLPVSCLGRAGSAKQLLAQRAPNAIVIKLESVRLQACFLNCPIKRTPYTLWIQVVLSDSQNEANS